ncbi:MAG: hypothetical protein COS84_07365 [Armatimonadetes bacterium CG07_land_8_20_14_0_80_40_9]|nr:MAG: hypothetical protein COS84_07365 [Armatimonadetes bacterium CG07_land_8_20_14_0_80_40_9]
MKITFTKTELNSKSKIKEKLEEFISSDKDISRCYNENELFSLILSAIRVNEANIVDIEKVRNRTQYIIDTEKIKYWIERRLLPNTIQISTDDKELLKLLIFSLAMPYKMLKGETRATMSEKTRRGKERDFEQIFSDTFVGKIGEVVFKQFAKDKLGKDLTLDWSISREIETFKSDIMNSKKIVSIKSTDTLESIWAEAPKNADYGILVKVSLPKDFFMKILAYISSLEKLLNFVKEKIQKDVTSGDTIDLVNFIKETAYGEQMVIKAFTCGFFKTSTGTFKRKGDKLLYIGGEFEIYEDKHLVKCNELKFAEQEWGNFFNEIF